MLINEGLSVFDVCMCVCVRQKQIVELPGAAEMTRTQRGRVLVWSQFQQSSDWVGVHPGKLASPSQTLGFPLKLS